jgi:hypothetical protein
MHRRIMSAARMIPCCAAPAGSMMHTAGAVAIVTPGGRAAANELGSGWRAAAAPTPPRHPNDASSRAPGSRPAWCVDLVYFCLFFWCLCFRCSRAPGSLHPACRPRNVPRPHVAFNRPQATSSDSPGRLRESGKNR